MNKLISVLFLVGLAVANPTGKVDFALRNHFQSSPTADIVIDFVGGNRAVVADVEHGIFADRTHRLNTLKDALKANAQSSQQSVQNFLTSKNVQFKSFWISNQLFVKNADETLVAKLASQPNVEVISQEIQVPRNLPKIESRTVGKDAKMVEWGIERVRAVEAWETTNGTGVVVCNIDGGVHGNHEALRDRYRNTHGWLDPSGLNRDFPADHSDGHGTHTMGSIAGSHGIGVAPGATWIACRGCGLVSCPQSDLTACAQWALCPTQPDGSDEDCSKAPALVSNSWGGGQGNKWYEPHTEAWVAGGIIPLFSNGNSGPRCGSANSPADIRRVIAVGATNSQNRLASFSSVGPSVEGRMKPELSGPGESIRSALPGAGDNQYGSMSGTSMSCPHAAGVTALLVSLQPNLDFGGARQALLEGCDQEVTPRNEVCGNARDDTFPNNHFGWGIINAMKIVENSKRH